MTAWLSCFRFTRVDLKCSGKSRQFTLILAQPRFFVYTLQIAYTRVQCLTDVRQVGQDALANFDGNLAAVLSTQLNSRWVW